MRSELYSKIQNFVNSQEKAASHLLETYKIVHSKKVAPTVTAGEYHAAVTRIRTWVTSATTKGTNHYTITALGAGWK